MCDATVPDALKLNADTDVSKKCERDRKKYSHEWKCEWAGLENPHGVPTLEFNFRSVYK